MKSVILNPYLRISFEMLMEERILSDNVWKERGE